MKRFLLFVSLTGLLLAGCKDEPAFTGQNRFFDVQNITDSDDFIPLPPGTITTGTTIWGYRVTAQGGPNKGVWMVDFEGEEHDVFTIMTDMATNRFQVVAPGNMTPDPRTITVKVDYGDTWKYIDLTQTSRLFFVDKGENTAGQYRYTVGSTGGSVYVGPINNPDGYELNVAFKSGTDVFTPVLDMSAETEGTLRFTSTEWAGFVGMGYGLREAIYEVTVTDHPELTSEVIVRQSAPNGIPAGAIAEYGVLGGYFFRMKNGGLDVAGIDLLDVDGKAWNTIFTPSEPPFVNVYTDWTNLPNSSINPCPEGWRAATLDDAKRLIGGTVNIAGALTGAGNIETGYGQNWSGRNETRLWNIVDAGGRDATFGIFTQPLNGNYYHLMLATPGCHASAAQFARIQIRNADEKPVISIAGRTTPSAHPVTGAAGDTWYAVRCVRDTPAE